MSKVSKALQSASQSFWNEVRLITFQLFSLLLYQQSRDKRFPPFQAHDTIGTSLIFIISFDALFMITVAIYKPSTDVKWVSNLLRVVYKHTAQRGSISGHMLIAFDQLFHFEKGVCANCNFRAWARSWNAARSIEVNDAFVGWVVFVSLAIISTILSQIVNKDSSQMM